jgi:Tfp pilus assembly PilM family ATPase
MALKLPRLQRTVAMTTPQGTPTITFHIWFDAFGKNIEAAVDGLDSAVLDIQTTQDELAVTQGELATAQAELTVAVADIAAAQADIAAAQSEIVLIQTDVGTITADLSNYVQKDQTAAWGTPTGTLTRTTFATYAGQTISAVPTQAEVQAIDDHVKVISERLAALISDLRAADVLT